MQTTHFRSTTARNRTTRGQIALYSFAALLTLWLAIQGGSSAWAHRHDASQPADPNSFRGGLDTIFSLWKRDVWDHPRPQATPAPVSAIQSTPTSTTQAPAATATPYQATDEQMSEWRHVPPGQQEHYDEYQQRLAAQQPTPKPFQPYMPPEAMPDPIAAKHAQWQGLHDAFVQQIRVRVQNAKTDSEKGQIQRDIAAWRAANPEPAKPTPAPNENEIPIH